MIRDALVLTHRGLIHWRRNPMVLVSGLTYPIVMVGLFGLILGSAMVVPGGGEYAEFLMPGMFAQAMANGLLTTSVIVATDARRGVTDRVRTSPVSPASVVLGRSVTDLVNSVFELIVLVACGLAIGWTAHGSLPAALTAIGLLLLLRWAMVWLGIYLGLSLTPEAAGMGWMVLLPLTMLANTFVAPEQLPAWLGVLAEWNPLSATVSACRELFGNPGADGKVLPAVLWPLLIIGVFAPLSVRRFTRLS
ncbi:transport permease protein [Actinorhabdospora filicis]|uniref:Transport permease protein n=1 Tax=Actinorhabdospora filicis TaxID=1785913 RepID=A0A9W6W9V9_9ACTN|nr:ABC transporter permease [Actinorhabdospora filicis]GLZ77015.1 transport permease protein [Actinorhabdospora filicis]